MARPKGKRNADYVAKRDALAAKMANRIALPLGAGSSLRELAAAAEIGLPTLRHYFGDRDGAIGAAMGQMRLRGEPWLAMARDAQVDLPVAASTRWFLGLYATGWQRGLGTMLCEAMAAGVDQPALGPAFVDALLEPTLAATEHRLAHHAARGEIAGDLRHAALQLLCPVLLGLMHQHTLSGSRCRPLDLDAFLDDHVARWVRAWSP